MATTMWWPRFLSYKYRFTSKITHWRDFIMFWAGCLSGYIVGSVLTCALLYFTFMSEERKKQERGR